MLFTFFKVIEHGRLCAGAEIATAARARRHHFQKPMGLADKAYSWFQGFCTGIGQAMRDHQVKDGKCFLDASRFPAVCFNAHVQGRRLLSIEVASTNAAGDVVWITSTLNYTEAQAVRTGMEILRQTGVFSINEVQASLLLECTQALSKGNPANPNPAFT